MSLIRFSSRKKLPLVMQSEAAECGLACLVMVASYHGYETDLPTLRRRFSVSAQGMTLAQLMQFATRLDLLGRPLRVELPALEFTKTTRPSAPSTRSTATARTPTSPSA